MIRPKRIVLTAGEPAGIGPELCVQIAQHKHDCQLIVIADPILLRQRAEILGLNIDLRLWNDQLTEVQDAGEIFVVSTDLVHESIPGQLSTKNASYVINTLQTALDGCLSQRFDAVVTAPVHKAVINEANIPFTGHTEFFADGAGIDKVVMMLAADGLRVALATTHIPLMEVSTSITRASLERVIRITHTALKQQFGIHEPKIAVCGLNPHAGESGHLGKEELVTISPVIEKLYTEGMLLTGPWPADTIFNQERLNDFDTVLAMYHDQGLPVLKHYAFGKAVNVTLGLPFIRTSVDHGTALDLAGTGRASETSFLEAIKMAEKMINAQSITQK